MSVPAEFQPHIRFGEFQLDLETAELRNNGTKSSLQGQPLQILAMPLERPGRLVTREELKKRLWPTDTFVDFDQSLNRAVNRLREALGDSAEQPHFVETLPRRGYRFIAPVTHGMGGTAAAAPVYPWLVSVDTAEQDGSHVNRPLSSVSAPAPRWNREFVTAGILAAFFFLAAVGFVLRRPSVGPGVSFENLDINTVTDSGKVTHVAISPDGRYVAYTEFLGDKQALRLRQVATRSDVQILPPDLGHFVGLTFSPDGNYIYFVRSDRNDLSFRYLYSVPSLGGNPRKLITDVDSGIGFSPDGRQIAYEHWVPPRNEMELKIANADGTRERVLTVIHNTSFFSLGGTGPSWSPDGRTIAVSKALVEEPRRWVLFAVSVADGSANEVYTSPYGVGRPKWRPKGDALLVPHYDGNSHRTQLWTISFPEGRARRFTHDISDYSMDLDATKEGGAVAAVTGTAHSQIWASPSSDLTKLQQISSGESPMYEVKETVDGKILSTDWDGGLWIMNRDGTQRSAFGNVSEVSWFAPCGPFVFVTAPEEGSTKLMRMNADGTHATTFGSGNLWSPTCSKDGHFVYYVNTEQPQKIWRVATEGGSPLEVARILGDCIIGTMSLSPNGSLLGYSFSSYSGTSPGRHFAVVGANGLTVKSFDVPADTWSLGPYWTTDSKAFQYLLIHDEVSNIWEQSLAGGEPRQLTRFNSGQIFDFTRSADQSRLFFTRGSISSDVVLLSGLR